MEDESERVQDMGDTDFYTIAEMTRLLNDVGCGYDKKTIANWIHAFYTEEHVKKFGHPRKRSFGTQNKKPMEYPHIWFGAVIDEHESDIRDRIFEHVQVAGSQWGDDPDDPNESEDYLLFMQNYSLSGYEYMQEQGREYFEREDQYNALLKRIIIKALNIDTNKLQIDLDEDNISENLLDYVRTGSEDDDQ